MLVNTLTLFVVGIMLCRWVYALATNVMTIESWEIERHAQLVRRARVLGGYLDGPDGIRVKIEHHEYPYDIGIWSNICQGMGTANPIAWFWPFASSVKTDGLCFETNGFEEPGQSWPPPDPDRMPRLSRTTDELKGSSYLDQALNMEDEKEAFRRRQQVDFARRGVPNGVLRRKPFTQRFDRNNEPVDDDYLSDDANDEIGEEGWKDSGGNRLEDYGVEEDVEFYDEDDVPLAELLRRREQQRFGI